MGPERDVFVRLDNQLAEVATQVQARRPEAVQTTQRLADETAWPVRESTPAIGGGGGPALVTQTEREQLKYQAERERERAKDLREQERERLKD